MDYSKELQKIAKNLSVLHAEDDEIVSNLCNMILKRFFKTADIATNGKEALGSFIINKYDIVITDLYMPEMNGFELANELRKINNELPVMILSGYIQADMVKKFKEQNIYYLKKPFGASKFIELIHEMCIKREKK